MYTKPTLSPGAETGKTANVYTYLNPEEVHKAQQSRTKDLWDTAAALEWSDRQYSLEEFLSLYNLPQVVKVRSGEFDVKHCNLRAGETLVLHKLSATKKVAAREGKGRVFYPPLLSPLKVDIRATNYKETYNSVREIAKVMPKVLRTISGHFGETNADTVYTGQKFEVLRMDYQNDVLVCRDYHSGETHLLSSKCEAIFYPIADPKEYSLEELVKRCTLPLAVEFVEQSLPSAYRTLQKELFSATAVIVIEKPFVDNCIIASSKTHGQRTAVFFPQNWKFSVSPPNAALRQSHCYTKLCDRLQNAIDFTKLEKEAAADVFYNTGRRYQLAEGFLKESCIVTDAEFYPSDDDDDGDTYEAIPQEIIRKKPPRPPPRDRPVSVGSGIEKLSPHRQKPPVAPRRSSSLDEKSSTSASLAGNKPPRSPGLDRISAGQSCQSTETDSSEAVDRRELPPVPPKPTFLPDCQTKPPVLDNPVVYDPGDAASTNDNPLPLPDNLSTLSVAEVCACLKVLNMEQYVSTFQTEGIDGDFLVDLDEESLLSLGISRFHSKKLLRFIAGWRPKVDTT